jgi:hypothetical protein
MVTQEVTSIYYAHTSGHANRQFDSLMSNYNGGKSRIHVSKITSLTKWPTKSHNEQSYFSHHHDRKQY